MKYQIGDIVTNNRMTVDVIGIIPDKLYKGHHTSFYKLKCRKCNCEFERDAYTTEKRDVGCPICANRIIIPGVNDIPTTDPWMVPYFQGEYEEAKLYCSGSTRSIYPKCPICGRIKNTKMQICDLKRYHGFQCVCHDGKSFPNKFIYGLAEELKRTGQIQSFKEEFKIEKKYYDMCFINERLLVEMDSGINHGDIIKKHSKKKFLNCKLFVNDMQKDDIAKNNNYEIIRIDCFKSEFEFIKSNIMQSELSEIFDLECIDWNHILDLCTTNLVEAVCKYKKEHPKESAVRISKQFGISDVTVRKYLKMGNELGWCVYDSKIEWQNYLESKPANYNAIPVCVIPDDEDEDLMFYGSMKELEDKSEHDLGKKIWADTLRKNNPYFIDGYEIYMMKGDQINGMAKTTS